MTGLLVRFAVDFAVGAAFALLVFAYRIRREGADSDG